MRGMDGRQDGLNRSLVPWPGGGVSGRMGGWPYHWHGRCHVTGNAVAVPAPIFWGVPDQRSIGPPHSAAMPARQDGVRGRLTVLYGMTGGFVTLNEVEKHDSAIFGRNQARICPFLTLLTRHMTICPPVEAG